MKRLALITLCLTGCCHCPQPVDATLDCIASTAIEWASVDSLDVAANTWAVDVNLIAAVEEELAKCKPLEPYGPWPCRWVYGIRRELSSPEIRQEYRVVNGVLEIDNTYDYAVPAVLTYKEVRDSVWHCGPDNGSFYK